MSLVSVSSAATVSYDYDLDNNTVSMFDSSLGTLDKVTLTINVDPSSASVTVDNSVPVPASDDFEISVQEDVKVDILGKFGSSAPNTASVVHGTRYLGAGDQIHFDDLGMSSWDSCNGGNDTQDLTTGLSDFVGTGTLNVIFSFESFSWAETWGSGSDPVTTDEDVQYSYGAPGGTITYTYTVPEPATLGLLAIGGMAMLRRRRQR
ncbi:MAG: PEP-CTERM sorting domain-containing protein [Phycisphaerae bacterium]|nr:PEP-CTERM sorting domain-containing protein [Phycisphaerae bacterium]